MRFQEKLPLPTRSSMFNIGGVLGEGTQLKLGPDSYEVATE